MFGRKAHSDIPYIEDVSYLDHYNLFVTFDDGDQRIFDATQSIQQSPVSRQYSPIEEFKKFRFDYGGVYWGKDDDFGIMNDSIYDFSFPFSAIVSTSGVIQSLSMAWVRKVSEFPISRLKNSIRMYVHGKEADQHKLPHVHIDYKKTRIPFTLDGAVIGSNLPSVIRGPVKQAIKEWIVKSREGIAEEWNRQNPDNQIDPVSGEYK